MDLGQSKPRKAAAATLGVKRKGNVKSAAAASASHAVGRSGSGSGSAAGFSVDRRSGSAAGLFPVRRGSGPAALLSPNLGSNGAPSLAVNSSPIGSFTTHDNGTFTGFAGFPLSPHPSPVLGAADGGAPMTSTFGHSDATCYVRTSFFISVTVFRSINFGDEYLRPPRSDELKKILQENEARGFPGMLGSIDCMHWPWKNCPKGWAGMFTRGDKGVPTMILEAVATRDLRIWHAFFGTVGSQNDLNVLNKSPLFIQTIKGEAPAVHYTVNGTQYDMGYYLADKIYPEWAVFLKTVAAPQSEEHKLFSKMQEGARKDVECAFGVLQSRFDIVRRPSRLWKQEDVVNIMQACVILHNMIVEDEKESIREVLDLNENPSTTIVLPPEVRTSDNPNPSFAEALRVNSAIKARPTHKKLKNDLIAHIWQRYGNKEK